ncbi:MAG: hypothetical protein D6814_00350 [Calditrichaeota bacterium]|nr:MAG: hypothetical protein D6814_00350 [Calditrichota bacterium]
MLAEKISGTLVGLWLLVPEHLRLGSWDLLTAWSGIHDPNRLEPRFALQLVHESALCLAGIRQKRSLRLKGFETLNGLPFVATDASIHHLLDRHTVAEAESLQLALGQLRFAQGDYPGDLVLLDPHRIQTWTQRNVPLNKPKKTAATRKTLQTFFAVNGKSGQPIGCGLGSSAVTITQATLPLVERLSAILPGQALLVGDGEHFTLEMLNRLAEHPRFSFLFPMPRHKAVLEEISKLPFVPLWAGYAVAEWEYHLSDSDKAIRVVVQRTGETVENYVYKPFATTSPLPAADLMTVIFPGRWNIEAFFNTEAALGWKRASTLNMNIRLGRLSMGMIAQALVYRLRQKLPEAMRSWNAESIAKKLFSGIDGDIRVKGDTIIVTLYNAPNEAYFKEQYQNLPQKLEAEGIDPRVPWLYNFKVDFRFK